MYKFGIYLTLVVQVFLTVIFVALAAVGSAGTSEVSNVLGDAASKAGVTLTNQNADAAAGLSDLLAGAAVILWALAGIWVVGLILSSAAVHNYRKSLSGQATFNKPLAIIVAIMSFFTTFFGGLLMLLGMTKGEEGVD